MHTINFNRIREKNETDSEDFKGIYFNDISVKSEGYQKFINYATTMQMMGYPPVLYIDESIQEHFTQILFILKESYTDKGKGFTGWQPFTEKYLTEICEKDYAIYKSEWGPDGQQFVKMFPEKIKEFLHTYCDAIK